MSASDSNISSDELEWVPAACTLPTVEQPVRTSEFEDLFTTSLRALERVDSTTLRLSLTNDADERARDLAVRETGCCSFFGFDFAPAPDGAFLMTVTVPPTHVPILDALAAWASNNAGLTTTPRS
jgi:hypothetical protein